MANICVISCMLKINTHACKSVYLLSKIIIYVERKRERKKERTGKREGDKECERERER